MSNLPILSWGLNNPVPMSVLAMMKASSFSCRQEPTQALPEPILLTFPDISTKIATEMGVLFYMALKTKKFLPSQPLSETMDQWTYFVQKNLIPHSYLASRPTPAPMLESVIAVLARILDSSPFLTTPTPSIIDYFVFGVCTEVPMLPELLEKPELKSFASWYSMMDQSPSFKAAVGVSKAAVALAKKRQAAESKMKAQAARVKKEGRAAKTGHSGEGPVLPHAIEGKVCTRFPPEPSGYLHIGHVKAAMLNHYCARKYKGRLHFRFDDTNPVKENIEFVANIKRDLKTLGVDYDTTSYTSDHFDDFLERAEFLIKEGKAFVDDTDRDTMRQERMECIDSKNRTNSVEKNFKMWEEMKKGSEYGQTCVLRAKSGMDNPNGSMRDFAIYRVCLIPHHRTGSKYKVYPCYDFSCPIIDSKEGITHAMRTSEFQDRDEQYAWVCKQLGIRCPMVLSFSRMNLEYTVMSKRLLQQFVDAGAVDGWTDPRFPTVQGIRRRGMTTEALRKFVVLAGFSKSKNCQSWDKLWSLNTAFIDPKSPRFMAVEDPSDKSADAESPALVKVWKSFSDSIPWSGPESKAVLLHKKVPTLGTRKCFYDHHLFVAHADALLFKEGEKLTLKNWGNVVVKKIDKSSDGSIVIDVEDMPSDTNFRDTLKYTWLAAGDSAGKYAYVHGVLRYFSPLVSKRELKPEDMEEIDKYINTDTCTEKHVIISPEAATCEEGSTLQLERTGFFYVDKKTINEEGEIELILHHIPEGKKKEQALGR
ncbi:Glutaminyl-tRNA synthetase [Aduncisulcus paluster]|uniref:Glutaminyl-tRNA synthetase n=1 Tax=Aduncisulcus paluster TaxID=2918883 RepID=A0ABQ5KS91_9EUKA|nr:Glutaminyl-tRNA synthetase [Aduncisulcus paluster]